MLKSMHVAAVAALLVAFGAAPVMAGQKLADGSPSPAGAWQTVDGQATVKVSMCGNDGTALCALLTGLRGTARTPGNIALLNSYVVAGAQRSDVNVWLGKVHFDGHVADGHIVMSGRNAISVSGCEFVVCKTLQFQRVSAVASATQTMPPAGTLLDNPLQMAPRTVAFTLSE